MFKKPHWLSLRTGELPEAGISEGNPAKMYVVFGTDNPANCITLTSTPGPCAEPPTLPEPLPLVFSAAPICGGTVTGSRTRSVMTVYEGYPVRFKGLYDLSKPANRYGPECPTKSPTEDAARFVNVQMANGEDGYVYIWGTEGGANNEHSPVYLARIRAANIATGKGIEYWHKNASRAGFVHRPQKAATPLFTDHPEPCMAQLGIQHNPYLDRWIMLYHCNETVQPVGHPNGIFLRTATHPWGPWSAPTTIFDPEPDEATRSGYCYFIYLPEKLSAANPIAYPPCPAGSSDEELADSQKLLGSYYGPYFVAGSTTGTQPVPGVRASTTIYYTLDTYDPYGQLIMRSTILGPPTKAATKPVPTKPVPPCKGTTGNGAKPCE